jgi:hypothetical protein
MPFHLALYDSSIANGAILLQVTKVSDPIIAPAGNGFLVQAALQNLAGVAGVGTNLTRMNLTSGSIRKMFPFDFDRVNVGALIENPARFHDFTAMPYQLDLNEELDAFVVQSNAGAQSETVAVWFSDGPLRPIVPSGKMQTVHATATTTLSARAWTACTLTLDNGLDGGRYAIVGASAFSASGIFFRFVPRGGSAVNRPGGFVGQARNALCPPNFRYGGLGEWLRFDNTNLPQVEFFATAGDTSEEVFLDVIKVG